jgi:cobalt/nickel transport system permease protein
MTLSFTPLPCPESWLRRLDSRWKLAGTLIALCGIAVLHTLPAAALALLASWILACTARMPWRWYGLRIAPLGFFLGFFLVTFPLLMRDEVPLAMVGNVSLSWSGLRLALLIAAKAGALVTLVLTLLIAAPLSQTLTAAHALRVPGLLIQVTLLAYQYLFLLAAEMGRLRIALRVRGYRNEMTVHSYRTIAHVTGALLVRGHDRAERVAQAMRCRGFDGRFRCLHSFHTRWPDLAFFLCVSGTSIGLVTLDMFI